MLETVHSTNKTVVTRRTAVTHWDGAYFQDRLCPNEDWSDTIPNDLMKGKDHDVAADMKSLNRQGMAMDYSFGTRLLLPHLYKANIEYQTVATAEKTDPFNKTHFASLNSGAAWDMWDAWESFQKESKSKSSNGMFI